MNRWMPWGKGVAPAPTLATRLVDAPRKVEAAQVVEVEVED